MNIIEVADLTKKFGDTLAVDSISFEVIEGEIFGCLGPNGAGKITTILMLTGIIAPKSGYAEMASFPVDRDVERLRNATCYGQLQNFSFFQYFPMYRKET